MFSVRLVCRNSEKTKSMLQSVVCSSLIYERVEVQFFMGSRSSQ